MIGSVESYQAINDTYSESIRRYYPWYDEMIAAMMGYFHPWIPQNILELGCGYGDLTLLLCERFPEALITAVGGDTTSIEICQRRLGNRPIEFVQEDLRQVEYAPGSFDLVVSSLALHHLEDEERADLYKAVYGWLRPRGRFVFSDRYRDESTQVYLINRQIWRETVRSNGISDEAWSQWLKQESVHDHPGLLQQQIKYLKIAGFNVSEVLWRKYLWASILAQKY